MQHINNALDIAFKALAIILVALMIVTFVAALLFGGACTMGVIDAIIGTPTPMP